eukprot:2079544-Pleurochrysis_carterae.AAC.1
MQTSSRPRISRGLTPRPTRTHTRVEASFLGWTNTETIQMSSARVAQIVQERLSRFGWKVTIVIKYNSYGQGNSSAGAGLVTPVGWLLPGARQAMAAICAR